MYCTRDDLKAYLLDAYITAASQHSEGIVETTIGNVSAEIDDTLRPRFALPLATVPATLTRIASVISAYRIVGAVTSLMATESASGNEWLPLQTQYKQAMRELEAIRNGSMDIGLPPRNAETQEAAPTMSSISRPASGMLEGW